MPDRPDPPSASTTGGPGDLPDSSRADPIADLFSEAIGDHQLYSPRYGSIVDPVTRELGNTVAPDKLWTVLDRSAWADESRLRVSAARQALGAEGSELVSGHAPETTLVGDKLATWVTLIDPRYDATVLAPLYLDIMGAKPHSVRTANPVDGLAVEVLHSDRRHPVAALLVFAEPNLVEGTFVVRTEYRFTRDALPALGENLSVALQTGHGDSLLLRSIQSLLDAGTAEWISALVTEELSREQYGDAGEERRSIEELKRRGSYRPKDSLSGSAEERMDRYWNELRSNGWNTVVGTFGVPIMNQIDELALTLYVTGLPTHPMKAAVESPQRRVVRFIATVDGPEYGSLVVKPVVTVGPLSSGSDSPD